jgi:hypothetical protein
MPQKEKTGPERHYFRVIITYIDGETSGDRVFKEKTSRLNLQLPESKDAPFHG